MASTAASTSTFTPTTSTEDIRPQAGPLPAKRGEIGFQEDIHGTSDSSEGGDNEAVVALPARHPADREAAPEAASSPVTAPAPATATITVTPPAPTVPDSSSTHSTSKNRIIAFLKPKNIPSYGGLRLTTLVAFVTQILLLGGTIAGWALAIMHVNKTANDPQPITDDTQDTNSTSSSIFVHVIFGLFSLAQLLFLERRLFRLRAERYSFVHPGEMLPTSRRRFNPADASIGIAPWHRPPLPTYAAALAQTGHGTGDVEDHLIAAPPPPAYGNTRGSTLLLAGFLRESLRAQRPRSQQSHMSQRSERPLSYASRDEQWEEVRDADRARRLEETLSTLERPTART